MGYRVIDSDYLSFQKLNESDLNEFYGNGFTDRIKKVRIGDYVKVTNVETNCSDLVIRLQYKFIVINFDFVDAYEFPEITDLNK